MELITVENNIIRIDENVKARLLDYKKREAEMSIIEDKLKAELLELLSGKDNLGFSDSLITAILKKASTRTTVDSKRLKEELPEVYEEYSKTSNVSPSITLKYDI